MNARIEALAKEKADRDKRRFSVHGNPWPVLGFCMLKPETFPIHKIHVPAKRRSADAEEALSVLTGHIQVDLLITICGGRGRSMVQS
jgi:hypothetical protein